MKKLFLLCLLFASVVRAHDHVEAGLDPVDAGRLALSGPVVQLALYVPLHEFFSGYAPDFPGGCFADELTFTTDTNVLVYADGADPEIELVSVSGPAGGNFSFWDTGASVPTWSRPAGWVQPASDRPSFPVVAGGENHVHGRVFSVTAAGDYTVVFRARDKNNVYRTSADYTVTFRALKPPALSIAVVGADAVLSFVGRPNLAYDLQVCTDLGSGIWQNVEPHTAMDGAGAVVPMSDPVAGRPRAFYRLVEYR